MAVFQPVLITWSIQSHIRDGTQVLGGFSVQYSLQEADRGNQSLHSSKILTVDCKTLGNVLFHKDVPPPTFTRIHCGESRSPWKHIKNIFLWLCTIKADHNFVKISIHKYIRFKQTDKIIDYFLYIKSIILIKVHSKMVPPIIISY